MKIRILAYLGAIIAALSCSSLSQLQTQTFDDGLYVRSKADVVQTVRPEVPESEIDNLLADTRETTTLLLSSGDTLLVRPGQTVKFAPSEITVLSTTPSWYYSPWYYNSWYWDYDYWYRPYRYYSWYYDPWYHWDPWYYDYYWHRPYRHYYSWYYDPWYYDS